MLANPVKAQVLNSEGSITLISIQGWVFVLAGLLAVIITVFTVSTQAIKAALANPVKALRNE